MPDYENENGSRLYPNMPAIIAIIEDRRSYKIAHIDLISDVLWSGIIQKPILSSVWKSEKFTAKQCLVHKKNTKNETLLEWIHAQSD